VDDLGKTNLVGRKLAHYQIGTVIGAGGMGEVYRATDTKLGRDVALKVLPSDMAGDPDRLARFQREARAVAALNHPNVVTLYSVEESDNVHFFTMELIEGQPLDRLISRLIASSRSPMRWPKRWLRRMRKASCIVI